MRTPEPQEPSALVVLVPPGALLSLHGILPPWWRYRSAWVTLRLQPPHMTLLTPMRLPHPQRLRSQGHLPYPSRSSWHLGHCGLGSMSGAASLAVLSGPPPYRVSFPISLPPRTQNAPSARSWPSRWQDGGQTSGWGVAGERNPTVRLSIAIIAPTPRPVYQAEPLTCCKTLPDTSVSTP